MYFMELDGTMLLYNYYDDRYGIVPFRVNFGRRSRTEVENPGREGMLTLVLSYLGDKRNIDSLSHH